MATNDKWSGIKKAKVGVNLNSTSHNTEINVYRCIIPLIYIMGWWQVSSVKLIRSMFWRFW